MTSESVSNWQHTFRHEVRTGDGSIIGVVAAIYRDSLIVENAPKNQYQVQKQDVKGFDGREVNLKISKYEL